MNRWKVARNGSGSSRRNQRLKVSWLGRPCSSLRNPRRNGSFAAANAAMCVAPAAAQHGAQRDYQQFMEVVQTGIACPRVLQFLKASNQLIQCDLSPGITARQGVESITPESGKRQIAVTQIPNAIPLTRPSNRLAMYSLILTYSKTPTGASGSS